MTYVVPVLLLISGLIVLYGQRLKRDDASPKRRRLARRLVYGGGVLVVILAFVDAIDTGKQQGRIETLANETKTLVTGGDAFIWVQFIPMQNRPDEFLPSLVHDGDTVPAYDIDIEFSETKVCDSFEKWTMARALATGSGSARKHYLPVFGPKTIKVLPTKALPSCDRAYYLALIQLRNRSIIQQSLIIKREEQWHIATRVEDVATGDELLESVSAQIASDLVWPDLTEMRKAIQAIPAMLRSAPSQSSKK